MNSNNYGEIDDNMDTPRFASETNTQPAVALSDDHFSVDDFRQTVSAIEQEVGKVIVGQRELVRQ
jgi:hypothetical protein